MDHLNVARKKRVDSVLRIDDRTELHRIEIRELVALVIGTPVVRVLCSDPTVVRNPFLLNERTRTDWLTRCGSAFGLVLGRSSNEADLRRKDGRKRCPCIGRCNGELRRRDHRDGGHVRKRRTGECVGLDGVKSQLHCGRINRRAIGEVHPGTKVNGPGLEIGTRRKGLRQVRGPVALRVIGRQRIKHRVTNHVARNRPAVAGRVETIGFGFKRKLDRATSLGWP
ncbi:unannotated protein [freshwater metagenome]|uniref:Unannotated protein n=1 Tax=freshwater metagenome TaxID=449393 RepID=A0A6J7IX24_9ZZZZ